jgi:hypothetical protein
MEHLSRSRPCRTFRRPIVVGVELDEFPGKQLSERLQRGEPAIIPKLCADLVHDVAIDVDLDSSPLMPLCDVKSIWHGPPPNN